MNWYAYCNNNPVNWVDPWGLSPRNTIITAPQYSTQDQWAGVMGQSFAGYACAATAAINESSEEYTTQTGEQLTLEQARNMMQNAIDSGSIDPNDAFVNNWETAANEMWVQTGRPGSFSYNEQGGHQIFAVDIDFDGYPDHFVNSAGAGKYFDTYSGATGSVSDLTLQANRPTRGFDFMPE